MSEDEKEETRGGPRYVVRDLIWRSDELGLIETTLDYLHLSTRFKPNGKPRRGKFPHLRTRNTARPSIPGHPPKHMPRNCYAPGYLDTLDPWELRSLDVQEPIDLSLSSALLRCVYIWIWFDLHPRALMVFILQTRSPIPPCSRWNHPSISR